MHLNLCARIGLVLTIRIDQCPRTARRAADGRSTSRHPAWDSPRCAASDDDSPRARGFLNAPAIRR